MTIDTTVPHDCVGAPHIPDPGLTRNGYPVFEGSAWYDSTGLTALELRAKADECDRAADRFAAEGSPAGVKSYLSAADRFRADADSCDDRLFESPAGFARLVDPYTEDGLLDRYRAAVASARAAERFSAAFDLGIACREAEHRLNGQD